MTKCNKYNAEKNIVFCEVNRKSLFQLIIHDRCLSAPIYVAVIDEGEKSIVKE